MGQQEATEPTVEGEPESLTGEQIPEQPTDDQPVDTEPEVQHGYVGEQPPEDAPSAPTEDAPAEAPAEEPTSPDAPASEE